MSQMALTLTVPDVDARASVAHARPLRVAQVITGLVLGGGGQVMRSLAHNIDRTRFDVDFYCVIEGGPVQEELEALRFRVQVLHAFDYRRVVPYRLPAVWALSRMLRHGGYDIVHTHLFQADVIGRLAALLAGTPHVVRTLHNMGTWKKRRHVVADRLLNRWTDRVVCVSDHQRLAVIRQEKLAAAKVLTIHNGVDVSRFRRVASRATCLRSLGLDPDRPTVGTVGRFIEEKGHIHLIEAMPRILERHPNVQFLLVGDGRLRRRLEDALVARGCRERASLPGLRADIPELLSVMDVFVFPSLSEGFGIAPFEAMAAGVPVACTSIPPLGQLLTDRETALLFPASSPEALADAVSTILSDPELRNGLVARGLEFVSAGFSEASTVRAIENLYLGLCSRDGKPTRGPMLRVHPPAVRRTPR